MNFKLKPNIKEVFKIEPGIIISKLNLKDGDTIVLTVDMDIWDIDSASQMGEILKKHFPNNNVLITFKGIEINAADGPNPN